MGRCFAAAAGLTAWMLVVAPAHAQQPPGPADPCAPVYFQPAPCPPQAPCICAPPTPYACPPPPEARMPAGPREELFAIDLIAGQQTGIRGQVALFRDTHEALVLEGFFGELFHNLGSSLALGAGARYLWETYLFNTCSDGFLYGPGVNVFFQTDHYGLILLTPSFDIAYVHRFGRHLEWEIGLDVGLGIGVAGHTHHGNNATGDVTTLVSFFTGIRF